MKNEAHSIIKINQPLTKAEWRFFDNEEAKANILHENHVKITQREIEAWGNEIKKRNWGWQLNLMKLTIDHKWLNYLLR